MLGVGCKTTLGFSKASLAEDEDAYLIGSTPPGHYPSERYPIPRFHFLRSHAGEALSVEDEKGAQSMETRLGFLLEQLSIPANNVIRVRDEIDRWR